jgi:hypothetical protein
VHKPKDGPARDRADFAARLAEARSWELRTIADRGAAIDRVLALIGKPRGTP